MGSSPAFAHQSVSPTVAVQFAMVSAAQRDGKLVADLEAEAARLPEPQMMGIAGLAPANEARLFGHEPQVGLVTQATRHGDCQHAFCRCGSASLGSSLAGPVRPSI
jgi:hypothetical protein